MSCWVQEEALNIDGLVLEFGEVVNGKEVLIVIVSKKGLSIY